MADSFNPEGSGFARRMVWALAALAPSVGVIAFGLEAPLPLRNPARITTRDMRR
ncbi:MAG: hypothetical protein ACOH2H_11215 [Cypionkella sp.]